MIQLLVSVRNVDEALLAAHGGADFIDLKEPGLGALGGLPTAMVRAVVAALHGHGIALPISATIGDLAVDRLAEIVARVRAVGECGVDYVKVGIERGAQAPALLEALADCEPAVVPVFIADRGIDPAHWRQALSLPLAGVMVDTADKRSGCLFDVIGEGELRTLLSQAREAGRMVGLAGALRLPHLDRLCALAPDFAGFRSAVCAGARSDDLDPVRLAALAQALRAAPSAQPGLAPAPQPPEGLPIARTSPSNSDRITARSVL